MSIPATDSEPHCYAVRLLNPYRGVAQIVDIDGARAISVDGLNWRLQLQSAIFKTPWSSLAIPGAGDSQFFNYGVWSQLDGLARIPIHPGLYQDHVQDTADQLLLALDRYSRDIPFALEDTIELWLMDPGARHPVALLASQIPSKDLPGQKSLLWQPAQDADEPFTRDISTAGQQHDGLRARPEDLMSDIITQRCGNPPRGLWVEREPDGSGIILASHTGKRHLGHERIAIESFPPCLLREDWSSEQATRLVEDYLNWLAPALLMLPLEHPRRQKLEQQARHRPLAVHAYHRLYPEIADPSLLNSILVEAVMRKSAPRA